MNTVQVSRSIVAAILVMNAMCARGTPARFRPEGRGSIEASMRAIASSEDSRKTAPFGRPVVPLVHTIATAGSSDGSSRAGSDGSSASTPSSATMARAPDVARMCSRSRGPSRVLIPDVTSPAFAAPRYATGYSGAEGSRSATTSPGDRPSAVSRSAIASDRASQSA
jgi:hypothetical protein